MTKVGTEKGGALSTGSISTAAQQARPESVSAQSEECFWFAVQTRPRHEKKVNSNLSEKGIHGFLPLRKERKRWSDRHQWVELPLFSQYVFVRIPMSLEFRARVLQTAGVVQFAGAPGRGTPIPEAQIASLQTIVSQRVPIRAHEYLRVGERVRIYGGALDGIEGVLTAIQNEKTLVVSVDLIQKSVAIRIDGLEVERVS